MSPAGDFFHQSRKLFVLLDITSNLALPIYSMLLSDPILTSVWLQEPLESVLVAATFYVNPKQMSDIVSPSTKTLWAV